MSTFDDREAGFEAKFAHDAEMEFRILARRRIAFTLPEIAQVGLTEAEADAYARAVVQADFEEAGDDDVVRKIIGDLLKAGIEVSDIEVRAMLSRKLDEARAQLLGS
jgi:hypothetical protein